MKTFLRKVKLSFLAMLCGWVACNIAWWIGSIPGMDRLEIHHITMSQWLTSLIAIGIYTAIVIAVTWLVLFLPVDLLVSPNSKLREPHTAAFCGLLSSSAVVFVVLVLAAWNDIQRLGLLNGIRTLMSPATLPYVMGTCATGTVAAYCRSLMGSSSRQA